ncbi:receptor-type tyrosine-protein phosphatase O-like [Pomacea canaliculata]|uniref:receptor-type tyrosine-protein phosphatase O-like n=1 Tax=Pomacea canaliculata TaxID=400727 RepID=UPI000D73B8D9|nr:receptor-type tyrosine-protein phosphatase O-like [Pomacea canaliculata]
MVYEHRTRVIVMLCDSVENGKKMVDPYWPDEINVPVRHGELTVTMTGVSVLETYAVRKIIVTMRGRQDLRVTQLCIRGSSEYWSLRVEQLIDFIRVAGRQAKHSRGPVTVHCNLGVGRTGMFIALDLLTRFVEKHNLNSEVNVYDVVKRMMGCRPNIIQSLDQYMFIHYVLGLIIEEKMQNCSRRIPSGVFYQNEGHTVNVYNELYESIGHENIDLQRY